MEKTAELEKIKTKIGIDDLASATGKHFERMQELAANGEISKEQMRLLVEAMPHFLQLQSLLLLKLFLFQSEYYSEWYR